MKTYEITRYAFNELSSQAQERAIEKIRESESENYPQELLSEIMNQQASYLLAGHYDGLAKDLNLYYDLSHSQGSGVAFSGEIFKEQAPNLTLPENCYRVVIKHSGRYYHEYSFDIELYDIDYEEIEESESVLEQLRDICRQLERYGYKWEENYFSDTNMKELAENMGEVFTEAGLISDPVRS